jgi:hypothetical protein
MSARVHYQGGGFEVSDTLLKTPRKSYALAGIEYVSVTRPLLLFTGPPAVGLVGFAVSFGRYLHMSEIATLAGLSVAAVVVAAKFGVLRVHSLALRDDEVAQSFGPIGRLRAVRAAVETAMAKNAQQTTNLMPDGGAS